MGVDFNYIDQIIEDCQAAKKAETVYEGEFDDFSKIPDVRCAVYVIRQIEGNKEENLARFKKIKIDEKGKASYPKLNEKNQYNSVLYVGSSKGNLRTRLTQHIKGDSRKTSSLKLNEWFKGTYKIEIKVYEEKQSVLQIIEDNLAYQLKPVFGKMGGNGRS